MAQIAKCNVSNCSEYNACEFEEAECSAALDPSGSAGLHHRSLHAPSGMVYGLALGIGAWTVLGVLVGLIVGVARTGFAG